MNFVHSDVKQNNANGFEPDHWYDQIQIMTPCHWGVEGFPALKTNVFVSLMYHKSGRKIAVLRWEANVVRETTYVLCLDGNS